MKSTATKTRINKTDKITLLQNNLQNVRLSEGFNNVYSENMTLIKSLETGLKSFSPVVGVITTNMADFKHSKNFEVAFPFLSGEG